VAASARGLLSDQAPRLPDAQEACGQGGGARERGA
jgi:hypothetical protein